MNNSVLGFNGECLDLVSGMTLLGNGYRAYNPVLQRFNAPDTLSPFEAGGLNPYAYCAGDPVNHADPSGHLSWQTCLGIGMGAAGLVMAVFTAGSSIAAAGGMMAAIESASAMSLVTGVAAALSDVAAIASGAAEGSNPQASANLGWVSLGLGIVGMIKGGAALTGGPVRPFKALMDTGRRNVAQGIFLNPRYLGLSRNHAPGFDFLFEDTTSLGRRRLNIVTREELQYGYDPTLTVHMWNDETRTNEVVHYSPMPGQTSRLHPLLLDEARNPYPAYRFGVRYAANTLPVSMASATSSWHWRNFAIQFSHLMVGATVEVSRGDVSFHGDAWTSVAYAIYQTLLRRAPLDGAHGQELLNAAAYVWAGQTDVFTMDSEQWVTYLNGRLRQRRGPRAHP